MKRLFSLLATCIPFFGAVHAQDIIILKTGYEIKSKVLEIGLSDIKYRRTDNPDSSIVTLPINKVLIIKYQDGAGVFIDTRKSYQEAKPLPGFCRFKYNPKRIGFYTDPGGCFTFGPSVGMEKTYINHVVINAHLRFPSLGLMTKDYNSGTIIGSGFKILHPSRLGGYYSGWMWEFGRWTYPTDKGTYYEETRKEVFLLSMLSMGYKFRFPSGFYIDTGGCLAGHLNFVSESRKVNTSNWSENGYTIGVPMTAIEVAFGIEF